MIRNIRKLNKFILQKGAAFLFVFFLISCQELALETQGDDRAQCEEGYEFKTITRKCESIVIKNAPPKAILERVVLEEDTDPKTIELTFLDPNDDPPLGCDITSFSDTLDGDNSYPVSCYCDEITNKCFAKIKPDTNFFSHGEFSYVIFDRDGRSNEKFVFVEVTAVDDPPSVSLDEFSEDARNAAVIALGIGVSNDMSEDSTKTFEFFASDPDGDLIDRCEIVETSVNIDAVGECECRPELGQLFSVCEVGIKAKQNFNGIGEFFTYKVFSEGSSGVRLYSGMNSLFININPIDDGPVLCQVSTITDAPECSVTERDTCVGFVTPEERGIIPTSHTAKIPVTYLNETTGECFRSYVDENENLRFVGSIRDEVIFSSGITDNKKGTIVSYAYGADFVIMDEKTPTSTSQVSLRLSPGYDVDDLRSSISYVILDEPEHITIKNCLGRDSGGNDDFSLRNSLDCTFELNTVDHNDHHLSDTAVLNNNSNEIPSLRFRSRVSGNLKESMIGPICLSFIGGNTNAQASVAYEKRDIFSLDDGPYCQGGYGDEVEYNSSSGNICGEKGVASIELLDSEKISIGDTIVVRVSGLENPDTIEDKLLTFSDCGQTCLANQIHLDSSSGGYKNNYSDYRTTLIRRILDRLRAINDGSAIEAKISSENPNKVIFRSRTLAPTSFYVSKSSSGLSVSKIQPRWIYRGDSGVGDLSCVGENGTLGNHFIISIENDKTTSATIKTAIESHTIASSMIEVFMYGSINESYKPKDLDPSNVWPLVLRGGGDFSDSFTYKAISNGKESNVGRVYFNISDINQVPELDVGIPRSFTGTEENTLTFSIPPAEDPDFLENIRYEIHQDLNYENLKNDGILRGCLNLEGSDGPWDLTCEFIPNPNSNTTNRANIFFQYKAVDSNGESSSYRNVEIIIDDNNDPSFICQYDTFEQAPECGLTGCLGNVTPVGRIIPSSHTSDRSVVFYSKDEQTCFQSTGSASSDNWEKVTGSIIRDVEINQLQKIIIDNLIIDEGGQSFEDSQEMKMLSITFPDQVEQEEGPDFLPVENITIFSDNLPIYGPDEVAPYPFNDDASADQEDIRIEITPVASKSGEATVRLNFADFEIGGVTQLQESFAEFNVKLNQVNVTHNGWKNLKVLGPRIGGSPYCEIPTPIVAANYEAQLTALTKSDCDSASGIWRSGDLVDAPNVCSFSETLCNRGKKCIGSDHTSASADEFNAIYKNTSTNSCYVAKSKINVAKAKITGKKAGGIFIYVEHLNESEDNQVDVQDSVGEGSYNHTSFIHLKLNPATTYDQLGGLIAGSEFDDDLDCAGDGDASCLLSIDLPSLSETTSELNIETDFPEGLYYLGIRDAYTYTNRGFLLVTYLNGLYVEVVDSDSDPAAEFNDDEKTLTISADLFGVDIESIKELINDTTSPGFPIKDSFQRPLFAAFTYDDPSNTIAGQLKTNFTLKSNSYAWDELNTSCSVTQSDELSVCREKGFGGSCLIFGDPIDDLSNGLGEGINADFNSSFYDQRRNRCFRLYTDGGDQAFTDYEATGSVKLEWENFNAGDASIAGFNVYRRIGKVSKSSTLSSSSPEDDEFIEGEFDLTKPINAELLGSNSKSFTDDFSSSRHPPLPGTVYYYTVKPVILGSNGQRIITNSLQSYSTVRVFSPMPNYAFVHRWVVNKTMCNLMHANNRTDLDSPSDYIIKEEENFRCRYFGVGMSDESGDEIETNPGSISEAFYDIGYDMLVNQSELSCPYSRRHCSFEGNEYADLDCIGNIEPIPVAASSGVTPSPGVTPRSDNAVYYNRANAKCYVATGTSLGDWAELNLTASFDKIERGMSNIHLPPISMINKDKADEICNHAHQNFDTFGLYNGTVSRAYSGIINTPDPDVPTRRQQRAFSLWSDDLSHEEIEILENGLSLNSTSRCNTQSANGLDEEFTSSTNPPVNSPETVTATDLSSFLWRDGESKLIRSLMTGSDITKNCQSRFGIQDHVGNLSEWSDDHFYQNTGVFFFKGNHPADISPFYNILWHSLMSGEVDVYTIGITSTDESNALEDRNFVIDSASGIAGAMNIPLGFPIRPGAKNDIVGVGDQDNFNDFIFPIGTTSGIETDHLHSDRVYLYQEEISGDGIIIPGSPKSQILFGGGFGDGGGAGVYFMQLEDPDESDRPDVGTRCVHVIKDEYYP